MINSNLMDTLKKDNIDVAIVYSGNPCILAMMHVLGVPVIYYDQEGRFVAGVQKTKRLGFSDETLVAAGVPLNLDIPLSNCPQPVANPIIQRFINGICLLGEFISQSGIAPLASAISQRSAAFFVFEVWFFRYRYLDGPITKMFANDYTFKKRFKSFPDVNTLKQESELFFVNTDPLLEYPHALPPHVIPVAGMHIDQPKPLFAVSDLLSFSTPPLEDVTSAPTQMHLLRGISLSKPVYGGGKARSDERHDSSEKSCTTKSVKKKVIAAVEHDDRRRTRRSHHRLTRNTSELLGHDSSTSKGHPQRPFALHQVSHLLASRSDDGASGCGTGECAQSYQPHGLPPTGRSTR